MHGGVDPDDDWAPLSPEQLVEQPGAWQPPPPANPAKKPLRRPSQPNPDGERLLAELQRRVAETSGSQSLVSAVDEREQRQRRRRARTFDSQQELGVLLVRGDAPADPVVEAPAPQLDLAASDMDVRETEAWFQQLPEAERERLRATWSQKRVRVVDNEVVMRRMRNRRMVAAWICFAATVFVGTGYAWPATIAAGIVCSIWWRHSPPDRLLDPVRAVACLFTMHGLALIAARAINPVLSFDCSVLIACAALAGFDGEIKRSGGFRDT